LLMFNILVIFRGLLGTLGNLELRNAKRRGMTRLAFNNVGLAGLVKDIDVGHVGDVARNSALAQAILGEVPEEN